MQLTDIYGARFVHAYGEMDSGVWYQALHDLSEEDVRAGLYAMLRDIRFETWPPNCTQFRQLCLQSKPGSVLPTVHQAFSEARQNAYSVRPVWRHLAVKFTVKYVGVDAVHSADTRKAFALFEAGYKRVCERIEAGFMVPEVADEDVAYYHRQKSNNSISDGNRHHLTLRSAIDGYSPNENIQST